MSDAPDSPARHALRTAAILLGFTVIGTALLAATFAATRGIVERNEQEARRALIREVLPSGDYDNDLIAAAFELAPHPLLGNAGPTTAYRAQKDGVFSAAVFEAVAPDGYSGRIQLLIAVRANGEVAGVRVIAHKETPGLGDYIERRKSAWIDGFQQASLARFGERDWQVKKDGGRFDYVTGATITPRAIVKAVHRALQYFERHRAEFTAAQPKRE